MTLLALQFSVLFRFASKLCTIGWFTRHRHMTEHTRTSCEIKFKNKEFIIIASYLKHQVSSLIIVLSDFWHSLCYVGAKNIEIVYLDR